MCLRSRSLCMGVVEWIQPHFRKTGQEIPSNGILAIWEKKSDLHTNTFVSSLLKWWMSIPAKGGLY